MLKKFSSTTTKLLGCSWLLAASTIIAKALSLETSDGLALRFSDRGQIVGVHLRGKSLPAAGAPGGIAIREAGHGGFLPLAGKVSGEKDRVRFTGKSDPFEVEAAFINHGERITIDGLVRNPSGGERCLDLKVNLPVDCRDWRWGTDLAGEDLIDNEISGQKTSDHITVYPLAPASNTKLGAGLTLAVPPTQPTLFDTGANKEGLYVIFKIGLSGATRPANSTSFKLILYRHDPDWGFRSSIQRYFEIFREPFFVRRVKKVGAWGWHHPPPSQLTNAALYAFHEAGGETWAIKDEGKHGYEHEGQNLAATMADYERLARFADDEKLGINSLPYTIVGQRQIYRLPKLPGDRDEALAEFEKWTAAEPMLFQSPGPSVGFRSVDQLKAIIQNSNLYDENQKPAIMPREYLGHTVTFPLNPNPNLFADSDKPTIAKYTLDDYLPMVFAGSKFVDGCYVDSLGRWCGYNNFRREHFQYSTVPLTYAGKTPQPCLWNLQSHAEYLWELSSRLHAQNKIVFANGIHANRVMLGFAVDVLGMEGLPSYRNRAAFYATRVAAATKPYCALNGRNNISPQAWNSCLYLGLLIGARSPAGQALERKYLPAIIQLNDAGWEPVTHARAEDPIVGVERWGGQGNPVYFSFLNRSTKPIRTAIRVERKPLQLDAKAGVTDLLSKLSLPVTNDSGQLIFHLSLAPEQATALAIR